MTNSERLQDFVRTVLQTAALRGPVEGARYLRVNRDTLEYRLRALACAAAAGRAPPAYLEGLSAFDLSDAMERLDGALHRLTTPVAA